MIKYIEQLLADITTATENVSLPFVEKDLELYDWITDEEENKTAPVRNLQDWTGIWQEMLPPEELLNDEQLHRVLDALKKMLDAYNWSFVLQIHVPDRIQYATIQNNFNQDAKIKRWHPGFFSLCNPGTVHRKCTLDDYCQCAFYTELFSKIINTRLDPNEQRARELEIEIAHIKRKYEDEWMKYYPYHLDVNYDDENGNPYNYGVDDIDEDNDWWR